VVGRQFDGSGATAVTTVAARRSRAGAFTTIELIFVCAILSILALLALLPRYVDYARARQVDDAATILSQDIAYLERFAQNSEPYEGATIEVESDDPLEYTCFSGRPARLDPLSHIRSALFVRSFADVALTPGPLGRNSALLFAHNGSIQYVAGQQWADQHAAVTIELRSRDDKAGIATLTVDPFTGAVAGP